MPRTARRTVRNPTKKVTSASAQPFSFSSFMPFDKKFEAIIYSDPYVLSGTQCFRGSRVPVSLVFDYLSLGWSISEINEAFPTVKPEYISTLLSLYKEGLRRVDEQKKNG